MRTRIYVAGPYSGGDIAANVREALRVGNLLLDAGYAPFVPHLSHYFHLMHPQPYNVWLEMDLAWVWVSDALLRLPGKSPGADREVALALTRSIPVYHNLFELLRNFPKELP